MTFRILSNYSIHVQCSMDLILSNAKISCFFFLSRKSRIIRQTVLTVPAQKLPASKLKSFFPTQFFHFHLICIVRFDYLAGSLKLKIQWKYVLQNIRMWFTYCHPGVWVGDGTLETIYANFLFELLKKKLWIFFFIYFHSLGWLVSGFDCLWMCVGNNMIRSFVKIRDNDAESCTFEWPTAKCINANLSSHKRIRKLFLSVWISFKSNSELSAIQPARRPVSWIIIISNFAVSTTLYITCRLSFVVHQLPFDNRFES